MNSASADVQVYSDNRLTLIQGRRQQVWGWPAAMNFILGGAGAGLCLVSICLPLLEKSAGNQSFWMAARLLASAMVALGLLVLTHEAGRPLRVRYLLGNLRRSWMSRETLAAMVFLPAAALSSIIEHPILLGIATTAAAAFIISQGFMVYRARAVPAWNVPWIPLLFATSALTSGGGVLLAMSGMAGLRMSQFAVGGLVVCAVTDLIAWAIYLNCRTDSLFQNAIEPLRTARALFQIVVLCRLFPIIALALALLPSDHHLVARVLPVIAGCALFAGSWLQKTGIIQACGFLHPIRLGFEPRRRA